MTTFRHDSSRSFARTHDLLTPSSPNPEYPWVKRTDCGPTQCCCNGQESWLVPRFVNAFAQDQVVALSTQRRTFTVHAQTYFRRLARRREMIPRLSNCHAAIETLAWFSQRQGAEMEQRQPDFGLSTSGDHDHARQMCGDRWLALRKVEIHVNVANVQLRWKQAC